MKLAYEDEIRRLSYSEAPKLITKEIPGPKAKEILDKIYKLESITILAPYVIPFVWNEARGATVMDPDGNVFIDMTAAIAVNAVGHNHPEVVETIKSQAEKLMHTADMPHPKRAELLEKLSQIAPCGMKNNVRTAFAMSGSDAAEMCLKFARWYTGRAEIITFHGGYHGITTGALTLTTNPTYKRGIPPLVPGIHFAPYAYCYRCAFGQKGYPDCDLQCARYVEDLITKPGLGLIDKPAAVIMEPLQGEGGYVVPPGEFVKWVWKVCGENNVVFIDDEVQSGFCRTGKWFTVEHWGVTPDILNLGKALGGDFPVAAVVGLKKIMDNLPRASQPVTFAGNALGCAVALKNIELMERYKLDERAARLGEYFMGLLKELEAESKIVGEVRGLGLMIGIEIVKDKTTKQPMNLENMVWLVHRMRDKGLLAMICGRWGQVFRFMPPLIITKEMLDKAFEVFRESLRELEKRI
ncbi:MAG: aspartate aminotransferase family protein [Candidatus Nezhaarchaeota archaeon]|nr:aspartate aminotransferase family protein [Candidatus Nezhaarchaeota archaeon]